TRCQPPGKPARPGSRIPHGVESAPTADKGQLVELGNLPALPSFRGRLAEATGERAKRGRSLRSSPRAGKPSTWRRQAVDTFCKQEKDNHVRHGEYRVHSRHAAQAVSVECRGPRQEVRGSVQYRMRPRNAASRLATAGP